MGEREEFIEDLSGRMTLDEKVGGCITFGFCGTRIDGRAQDKILRHHCAGPRLTPHVYTEEAYASGPLSGGATAAGHGSEL